MRSQLCNILCWARKTKAPHVCWMPLFAVGAHCYLWLSGDRALSWCLLLFKQMPVAAPGHFVFVLLCLFVLTICLLLFPAGALGASANFFEKTDFVNLGVLPAVLWLFWERAMLCILILAAYICYGKVLSSLILCCSVFYTHPFFKKLLLRSFGCLSNNKNHLALVSLANVNTSMQILVGAL